ncbi:transglycosylase domain-containing protein [Paenibacillus sp. 481]|uniref:transglycosylase domain-containing protein n=1 Tax=Paenibacillus sp. 481 TaxID=2835869 RepID=UPI001E58EB50|nr:PBP1A family penicillin-binding protein [Paenibacillus sp. 481]UHA75249.1 PBP1A family penicillin-binding protein [Paenibacillus sp. 481]
MSEPAKPRNKRKLWLRIMLYAFTGLLVIGLGAVVTTIGFLYVTDLPVSNVQQSSQLLDNHGQPLTMLTSSQTQQEPIELHDITRHLILATLAIEDRKFYSHMGIDVKGIARAMLVNLQHLSKKQGASTLTQQLARNLYLSHERTWKRKAKEALFAVQLEMKHSKDEILTMYLNQVYYGHGAYGVEAASKLYFGKKARNLSLAESALLAGIPRGPSYYSPYSNMKNAKDRQKVVLASLVETGHIKQMEADKAYAELLSFRPREQRKSMLVAPYFRDYVRKELNHLGISEQVVDAGGLRVWTTLDKRAQQAAEEAIVKQLPAQGELQAALVSIDPRNGDIRAMVGGHNYPANQYNRAVASKRQPGSSFKPLVYLAALEKRAITPATHFVSAPTSFMYDEGRKVYRPSNYGSKYHGDIDLRQAIAASDNIYAVSTMMQIGPTQVVSLAQRLGISSAMEPLPSLALGTFPVSPFEMAAAYGTISNGGKQLAPRAVLKVMDQAGNVLYEAPPAEMKQVVDAGDAYVLTNLMESVFEAGGTGNRVSTVMKRPVAGKTGTTDSDAWIVGYTPELSTAVWVGYDRGKMISLTESQKAAPIFADFTEKALASVPPKIFPVPDNVVSVYIDPDTGKLAGDGCRSKRLETFVKGTEPTAWCGAHPHSLDGRNRAPSGAQPQRTHEAEKRSWWRHFKSWWTE